MNWLSLFKAESLPKAGVIAVDFMEYLRSSYSRKFGPSSHGKSNPEIFESAAAAPVSGLHDTGCPSAVFVDVPNIVVNPIYRISFGWLTHVFKEIFEYEPSVTHINTSSAVAGPRSVVWVRTPSDHVCPDTVHTSWLLTLGVTVCRPPSGCLHFVYTSARRGIAAFKVASGDNTVVPAFAQAKPPSVGVFNVVLFHYKKHSVSISSKVVSHLSLLCNPLNYHTTQGGIS